VIKGLAQVNESFLTSGEINPIFDTVLHLLKLRGFREKTMQRPFQIIMNRGDGNRLERNFKNVKTNLKVSIVKTGGKIKVGLIFQTDRCAIFEMILEKSIHEEVIKIKNGITENTSKKHSAIIETSEIKPEKRKTTHKH